MLISRPYPIAQSWRYASHPQSMMVVCLAYKMAQAFARSSATAILVLRSWFSSWPTTLEADVELAIANNSGQQRVIDDLLFATTKISQ